LSEPIAPDIQALQAEIVRQNKVIQSLMNRAERFASLQGSDFNLFHTAITLKDQVRRRTDDLEVALRENEKSTRALRESENQIRNFAFYDTLTQLANRRLLSERLEQALIATKRSGRYGALIFLDLDNFKPLNDLHGHDAGDMLLVEVARRLTRSLRETDTVARMGGDEFVVILPELAKDRTLSVGQATNVAEKMRAALAEPYFLHRNDFVLPRAERSRGVIATEPNCPEADLETSVEHHCTASIGVVLLSNQDVSYEDVLKRADKAMYQAKASGRNSIFFMNEIEPNDPGR
jgi:diguanylate cyclase (GGDEF)-like protein